MLLQKIESKIYEFRGQKIMLDFDLPDLYEVETRVLNQAVKRNIDIFPDDFMFQLTQKEWGTMSSQIVMTSPSSQIVMMDLPKNRTGKYLPYVFTEHGVTMAASVLKSPKARKMNIAIVRAFIALKKLAHSNLSAINLLKELRDRIDEHDVQLKSIYDALENMLDEKEEERLQKLKWEKRERIGFKNK